MGTRGVGTSGCRDTGCGGVGVWGHGAWGPWVFGTSGLGDISTWRQEAWGHHSLGMLGTGDRGFGDSKVQEYCGLGTLVLRDMGSWGYQGLQLWGSGVLGLGTWLLGAMGHAWLTAVSPRPCVPEAAASMITLCTSSAQCWARTASSSQERRYRGGLGRGGHPCGAAGASDSSSCPRRCCWRCRGARPPVPCSGRCRR